MNNNPGVNEMLALLEALKNAVQDFGAREEKLNRDFHSRSAAVTGAFEAGRNQRLAALSERILAADDRLQAETEKSAATLERRNSRIGRAHNSARNRIVEDVSHQEGQRKHKIQQASLAAERQRNAALAGADEALAGFNQRAAADAEALARLESDSRKIFHGRLRTLLADDQRWPAPDLSPDENQLLDEVENLTAKIRAESGRFAKGILPHLFRALFSGGAAKAAAAEIAGNLVRARRLLAAALARAALRHEQEHERISREFTETNAALNLQWKEAVKWAIAARMNRPAEIEETVKRLRLKNEQCLQVSRQQAERDHTDTLTRAKGEAEVELKQFNAAHAAKMAQLDSEHQAGWTALEAEWKQTIHPLYEQIRAVNAAAEASFPDWDTAGFRDWNPPKEFTNAAKFGRLDVDLAKLVETMPKDERLALPACVDEAGDLTSLPDTTTAGKQTSVDETTARRRPSPANFSVPLSLSYPREGSILFETSKTGGDEAVGVINNIIYRLLATTPPGKLSFTIFDPVGLGQNFAGLMHLADYEDSNINSRIWTQAGQFEEKLAELNEHMEKVIQMYLRNEYATITEYNAQAGTIAEKYHILVIASFPVNFSDTAARRLRNIAASGARCGVYTLIHWDQRNQPPSDFVPDELRQNSVRLVHGETGFQLAGWRQPGAKLVLDPPPAPEFATEFLRQVGERSKDSNRVEVPFAQIAPADAEMWSQTTAGELRVPIGRSGATKLQHLAIGRDTRQHALIAGKTGSGKSTLFHVIITNLALWCSPEQVEFYLVDFKKGVEFKCYASRKLPHARVVAIESDREFGLSVLQRVDEELRRRGDLFRKLGAQDVAGYHRAGGTEAIPRSLLIIDEFQEFFTEEDRIAQGAAVLLDRIVRQGRAFGIHVLLGSQTLGGAYTLARATIGQMVIRIALQCNEADAYLIMDQDNPAPRLLSRPGEGIYNDTAGSIEGNSPFQVVWLPDTVRDGYLQKIRARAGTPTEKFPGPFVFEGNAPADIRENALLNAALGAPASRRRVSGSGQTQLAGGTPALPGRIWLGAPNSIKGPTEARFQRQSGSHLLVVGQNDEAALTMLGVALVSLAAQYPAGAVRFVLLDSAVPGSAERDFLDRIVTSIPHEVARAKSGDVTEVMNGLAADLERRGDEVHASTAPETFVLIHGLHNFKKLRPEDEFGFSSSPGAVAQPAAILLNLINEGPARGIHVLATCDSYNNVNRYLGRKNLGEFEMRVLFQMSASDSASLIDAPDAATLGLHRATFYNDREGYLETFRPYARPDIEWIETVARAKPL